MRNLVLIAALFAMGCATLESSTQRVKVVTEPPGATVAAIEHGTRKDLGPSPLEYERPYEAYRCGKAAWLTPLATTLLAGGAGFGVAYGTTARNDELDSGLAAGAVLGAIGLAVGVGLAATCRMKDGVTPSHREELILLEASKEGFGGVVAPLSVPSDVAELRLTLPVRAGTPAP